MSENNHTKTVAHWQWSMFALLQLCNLYQLLTHAMWRDELQSWRIAIESSSIQELFNNMLFETGFPPLWYLSLWLISFVAASPLAMQLFHFVCALSAQTLVMTRSPFPASMRLAIVAGYYFSFEYCVISRAYVLGVLLTFVYCAFQRHLKEHPWLRGGILGLLANTSVYGTILSLCFAINELQEGVSTRSSAIRRNRVASLGTYAALLFAAIMFMLPRQDSNYAAGQHLIPSLEQLLHSWCRVLISLLPLPTLQVSFWNSLLLLDISAWIAIPAALAGAVIVWLLLRSSPRYLGVFCLGFSGIWLFNAFKYSGYLRHTGTILVLLIACIWLARQAEHTSSPARHPRCTALALWCLLGVNLVAWAIASYFHLRYDFSGSREMARVIQPMAYPIVADMDHATSAVAGYLGRPFYYVTNQKAQTFIRWNNERADSGPLRALLFAQEVAADSKSNVLILLNYPIIAGGNIRFIAKTDNTIVADETFFLYEYQRPAP